MSFLPFLQPNNSGGGSSGPMREVLTGYRDYFASPTGSDANDGLTAQTPKTFQGALSAIGKIDFNGHPVSLNLLNGLYTGSFYVPRCVGLTGITNFKIVGNTGNPTAVRVQATDNYSGAIIAEGAGVIATVQSFQVAGGGLSFGLYAASGGQLQIGDGMDFADGCTAHIHSRMGGIIQGYNNYTISGGGGTHFQCETGGLLQIFYNTITITNPITINCFTQINSGSTARLDGATYVNKSNVTGTRYSVDDLCFVNTGGSGENYFPGTGTGSTSPLGKYV